MNILDKLKPAIHCVSCSAVLMRQDEVGETEDEFAKREVCYHRRGCKERYLNE